MGSNPFEPDERIEPERLVDGATFIFEEPDEPEAVWGRGLQVLWPDGEGVMLVGPQGVGKTTVMQQLALSRIGVHTRLLLDLPVRPLRKRKAFYLAMDRPRQIARSFQRMVTPEQKENLSKRLAVWKGPLPFDLARESAETLADWCADQAGDGCDVFCDSYKDLHPKLSQEDVGASINQAVQELLIHGMQWCGAHHQRKAQGENRRPDKLDDVYGSGWLTAGLGSVVCLWSKPGSQAVELTHLKQPAEDVGPLTLVHDHAVGRTTVRRENDLLAELISHGDEGMTDIEAALFLFGLTDRNTRGKAARRLNTLAPECAVHVSGKKGGRDGGSPPRWIAK
jgi:hypothetical protein